MYKNLSYLYLFILAQQTGTKVVPINPLSYDWEEEMLNVAKALAPQTATK